MPQGTFWPKPWPAEPPRVPADPHGRPRCVPAGHRAAQNERRLEETSAIGRGVVVSSTIAWNKTAGPSNAEQKPASTSGRFGVPGVPWPVTRLCT